MSKARSPRAVCSITIGITGLMLAPCRDDRSGAAEPAGQPCERRHLELAHLLPGQPKLLPDRPERPGIAAKAEAKLDQPPLALRKSFERREHPRGRATPPPRR